MNFMWTDEHLGNHSPSPSATSLRPIMPTSREANVSAAATSGQPFRVISSNTRISSSFFVAG